MKSARGFWLVQLCFLVGVVSAVAQVNGGITGTVRDNTGAVVAGAEVTASDADKGIRRSSDLFSIVDSRIVVGIPYITTQAEVRWQKRRIFIIAATVITLLIVAIAGAYLFMPPLDLVIAKARVGLFK